MIHEDSTQAETQPRLRDSDSAPAASDPRDRPRGSTDGRSDRPRLLRAGEAYASWAVVVLPVTWDRGTVLSYACDAVDALGFYGDELHVYLRDVTAGPFPRLEVRCSGREASASVAERLRDLMVDALEPDA